METRARYATIGFFTLVVTFLAFGFIYWLKRLDETGLRAPIFLEFTGTVNGLAPGGSIYFGGIKVGNVTELAFDAADPNIMLVTADVKSDTPIKVDAKATVGANFLTGVAYVEIVGGSPGAASVFDQTPPKLIGSRSGLSDVVAAAGQAVAKVDNIVDRVDKFLAVNETSITETVDNVRTFTDALAENSDGVKDFLANVSEMSKTISGLSERLNGLVEKADNIVAAVEPDKVRSTIDNADQFVKRIADASTEVESIVGDVKKVVGDVKVFSEGLQKTLADVQGLVASVDRNKIQTTIDNVAGFSDKLKAAGPDIDTVIADVKGTAKNANEFTANINNQKDSINQIVADAKSLAARLNEASLKLDSVLGKADTFLGGADGAEGKNFFQEATEAAKAIRVAAETITQRADEVASGVSKFSGRGLDNVSTLVNELRASVSRIDRAVADFSRNPAGALFGGSSGVREYNRR